MTLPAIRCPCSNRDLLIFSICLVYGLCVISVGIYLSLMSLQAARNNATRDHPWADVQAPDTSLTQTLLFWYDPPAQHRWSPVLSLSKNQLSTNLDGSTLEEHPLKQPTSHSRTRTGFFVLPHRKTIDWALGYTDIWLVQLPGSLFNRAQFKFYRPLFMLTESPRCFQRGKPTKLQQKYFPSWLQKFQYTRFSCYGLETLSTEVVDRRRVSLDDLPSLHFVHRGSGPLRRSLFCWENELQRYWRRPPL